MIINGWLEQTTRKNMNSTMFNHGDYYRCDVVTFCHGRKLSTVVIISWKRILYAIKFF
jgi:hypothetical protein